MPPFLFGGCVLVGQIYFVYVKGFVGLYDCRTGGHIPFNVKSVFLVEVGKVFVVRVLRYIVLIAEKGAHAAQLQNTFSSVHNCDFVLCHQLFATMSSDEFKNGQKNSPSPGRRRTIMLLFSCHLDFSHKIISNPDFLFLFPINFWDFTSQNMAN